MHLKILLTRLVDLYGDPIWLERQDACRWELSGTNGGPPTHLCLTMEPSTGKGSIWVFSSGNPHARGEYIHIHSESDLAAALEGIARRVPVLVH